MQGWGSHRLESGVRRGRWAPWAGAREPRSDSGMRRGPRGAPRSRAVRGRAAEGGKAVRFQGRTRPGWAAAGHLRSIVIRWNCDSNLFSFVKLNYGPTCTVRFMSGI